MFGFKDNDLLHNTRTVWAKSYMSEDGSHLSTRRQARVRILEVFAQQNWNIAVVYHNAFAVDTFLL